VTISVSTGGGGLVVAIEELLESGRRLTALAVRADAAYDGACTAILEAQAVARPTAWWLFLVKERLGSFASDARRLAGELSTAADAYAAAERAAMAVQHAYMQRWYDGLLLVPGRAFEEGAVEAAPAGAPFRASAPAGFAALAVRIPASDPAAPQVRVERYAQDDGTVRWVVYSAGTSSWNPVPGANPWDLTADVSGVEAGRAGSTAATMAALAQAGWRPGDEVLPVGHSQGGLVATGIATSGLIAAPMLVTFGSPTRQVKAPAGTLDIAVEHTDDVVPLTGGSLGVPGDRRVVVREAAPPVPAGSGGLPAHSMVGYQQTAQAMDESADARLVSARTRLARFTGGKDAEVTLWKGKRVPAPEGPPAIGSGAPSAGGW